MLRVLLLMVVQRDTDSKTDFVKSGAIPVTFHDEVRVT